MKLLIYMDYENIKPSGGPAGYLYNLKQELDKNNNNQIYFLNRNKKKNKYRKYYDLLPRKIKEKYRSKSRLNKCEFLLSDKSKKSDINFNEYDIIHFHSTFDMYNVKDSLKEYKGKIILTSHSPKPAHIELIEDCISEKDRKIYGDKYKKLWIVDEYAFNKADYIIFPCEEAEEPYYNNWDKYRNLKENNKNKYRYLLTGTRACKSKLSRNEICEKYNIPKDSFIVSYVGRHNSVKGYDVLKKMAKNILEDNRNVYFLIAGVEQPLKRINDTNWIEVGWTNDPHSIISASNLFILPNKETYFDLVLLEVLSLGKMVLLSNTGGNKHFKRYNLDGIIHYYDFDDSIEKLREVLYKDKNEISKLELENKNLFKEKFTSNIFYKNYIELIEKIFNE